MNYGMAFVGSEKSEPSYKQAQKILDFNQIFLIGFHNELGTFKQKKNYFSKCNFFLHFTATDPKA